MPLIIDDSSPTSKPFALPPNIHRSILRSLFSALLILLLGACSGLHQASPSARSQNLTLKKGDLHNDGVAIITPSTVTGQEQDKQALAMGFAATLKAHRPEVPVRMLSETLGAINRNGLAARYKTMFDDYRDTGIFSRDTLKEISQVTDTRYLVQLKLANFRQSSSGRFSVLGLRLVKTEEINIRLFLSIWDGSDGSIAWEGMQELNYAYDTFKEKPVTFKQAVEEASMQLIREIP